MSDNVVKRTGVIGLGAMGMQMARHMTNKGFAVSGYDIDAAAGERARGHGIKPCGSAAEVAREAEVIVIMVAIEEQVDDVSSSLISALAPNTVICIASSVSPDLCRRLADQAATKGIGVLDTPVVLGQEAADNGTLTVYVGGEDKWLERARPALQAFGRQIMHLGGVGTGQIAKTINNMLLWACVSANFEALTLAKTLGADIPRLVTALGQGSGANWSLSRWGKSTGKWAEKDMDVALELAQAAKVAAPLAGLVDQLMKSINQEKMRALLK